MNDLAVRLGIHELIAAYAECIDEDRLEIRRGQTCIPGRSRKAPSGAHGGRDRRTRPIADAGSALRIAVL
jgi:hypothetical protein